MAYLKPVLICLALAAAPIAGAAAQDVMTLGGDVYASGANSTVKAGSDRDVFVSGFRATVEGDVARDAHAMGFNVSVNGPVGGDAYAGGFNVEINSRVGEDVTASGMSVALEKGAAIGGNARLLGGTVTVDAPVAGSLVAAAGSFALDAAIEGDVLLTAGEISFGPDARIAGYLTYRSPSPVDIPDSVAPASRVRYEKLTMPGGLPDFGEAMDRTTRSFWPSAITTFFGFLFGLAFLVAVAAGFLALVPDRVEKLRETAIGHPWSGILLGMIGLATLIGLVPVAAMTMIGVPLVPLFILVAVVVWVLGWLLGAYALAWRIIGAFRDLDPTLITRLVVVVIGAVILSLLNYVPLLGWLINLAVMFIGLGALAALAFGTLTVWRTNLAGPAPAAPAVVTQASADKPAAAKPKRGGQKNDKTGE